MHHAGEMVRSALKDKSMTQFELARKIGKDQTLISRFINGHPVSDETVRSIAEILDLDYNELHIQNQRDKLERKTERLKTGFKEILDQEDNILSSEKTVFVGSVEILEFHNAVAIPLTDSVPADIYGNWREKAELYAITPGVQLDAKRSFALKISKKMADDKVDSGDIIIVDPGSEIQDGDRVLVVIGDNPALKKIYRRDDTIVLQSSDNSIEPVIFLSQKDNFKIIGRVRLCIKHL